MSFHFSKPNRQEQFSDAYVCAIAATAGYAIRRPTIDEDSVDFSIVQRGNGDVYPYLNNLEVQLKCSYAHQPEEGYLTYPLSVKNYNDLRRKCLIPRILIVVHVPEDCENWVEKNENSITLNYLAYWVSLKEMPETKNKETVSVKIPTSQVLTIESLRCLMGKLADEGEL